MPADLFPSADPFLPWLPGETLFSLCSRHHRLWGHRLSGRTSELLFGRSRAGTQHDMPNSIDEFVQRTNGQFGTADGIARERTLLRFYGPFMDEHALAAAAREMRGPAVAHLKFRLGLLTSRFRANHPLKACATCMHTDLERAGWVYWHLAHQYPGVWLCPIHGQPLRMATVKSTGVERFQWHLPTHAAMVTGWEPPSESALEPLLRFARLVCQVVERAAPEGWLHPERVQRVLRLRMEERNLVTPAGNVRLGKAAEAYLAHCAGLRISPELSALASSPAEAALQVGRLCRPWRSGTHPLRLLVAIDWMFDGLADYVSFAAEAEMAESPWNQRPSNRDPTPFETLGDPRVAEVVASIQSGASMTEAARRSGVNVVTAMAWAANAGIGSRRRPKILTPEVRRQLLLDLRAGADKSRAAAANGISVETVARVLRTEVGLYAAWKAARFQAAQASARGVWQQLVGAQPGVGVKMLRSLEPAAYAWLYRNDREWLSGAVPALGEATHATRRSPVRWDERDRALSTAVQRAALALAESGKGKAVRLWQLYQAVPDLKAKLAQLHRLPLTQAAIARALGSALRPCDGLWDGEKERG